MLHLEPLRTDPEHLAEPIQHCFDLWGHEGERPPVGTPSLCGLQAWHPSDVVVIAPPNPCVVCLDLAGVGGQS